MDSKDILLGIVGLMISIYGGNKQDLITLVLGISLIFFAVYLKLNELEVDQDNLKKDINNQLELKRIWRELDDIKTKFEKR